MGYLTFTKSTCKEMLFVAKAVDKKHSKSELRYVYVTEEEVVATDGHRLHVYTPEVSVMEPGYYEIIKQTKTTLQLIKVTSDAYGKLGEYPDFKCMIPEASYIREFITKRNSGEEIEVVGKYAEVIRAFTDNTVDWDYFNDANCLGMYGYRYNGEDSPLVLYGENIKAALSPLK